MYEATEIRSPKVATNDGPPVRYWKRNSGKKEFLEKKFDRIAL